MGVVNRGQRDIDNNLTIREALKKELHFFKNHPVYKNFLQRYEGRGRQVGRVGCVFDDTWVMSKGLRREHTVVIGQEGVLEDEKRDKEEQRGVRGRAPAEDEVLWWWWGVTGVRRRR